jgi:molecular chaperone DnaK
MVQEAAANADADRKSKEKAEIRNRADNAIYQTERTLKDLGDKVSASEKSDIESKIAALRSAVESDDTSRVESALTTLQEATYQLSSRLYQQAGAEGGTPPGGEAPGNGHQPGAQTPNDDVIDAEFKSEDKA